MRNTIDFICNIFCCHGHMFKNFKLQALEHLTSAILLLLAHAYGLHLHANQLLQRSTCGSRGCAVTNDNIS